MPNQSDDEANARRSRRSRHTKNSGRSTAAVYFVSRAAPSVAPASKKKRWCSIPRKKPYTARSMKKMSGPSCSPTREMKTWLTVIASRAAAIRPARRSNRRLAIRYISQTDPMPSSAEGKRNPARVSPSIARETCWSQKWSGGWSCQERRVHHGASGSNHSSGVVCRAAASKSSKPTARNASMLSSPSGSPWPRLTSRRSAATARMTTSAHVSRFMVLSIAHCTAANLTWLEICFAAR